jgi:hypothetical protein
VHVSAPAFQHIHVLYWHQLCSPVSRQVVHGLLCGFSRHTGVHGGVVTVFQPGPGVFKGVPRFEHMADLFLQCNTDDTNLHLGGCVLCRVNSEHCLRDTLPLQWQDPLDGGVDWAVTVECGLSPGEPGLPHTHGAKGIHPGARVSGDIRELPGCLFAGSQCVVLGHIPREQEQRGANGV